MEHGFKGAIRQFIRVGFITRESNLSFLDLKKVWNDLPDVEKGDLTAATEQSEVPAEAEQQIATPVTEPTEASAKVEKSDPSEKPATSRETLAEVEREE